MMLLTRIAAAAGFVSVAAGATVAASPDPDGIFTELTPQQTIDVNHAIYPYLESLRPAFTSLNSEIDNDVPAGVLSTASTLLNPYPAATTLPSWVTYLPDDTQQFISSVQGEVLVLAYSTLGISLPTGAAAAPARATGAAVVGAAGLAAGFVAAIF